MPSTVDYHVNTSQVTVDVLIWEFQNQVSHTLPHDIQYSSFSFTKPVRDKYFTTHINMNVLKWISNKQG